MGLLDDAIREHLELKRLRGADPSEIERAEREALGPVRRGPEPLEGDRPPAQPYEHEDERSHAYEDEEQYEYVYEEGEQAGHEDEEGLHDEDWRQTGEESPSGRGAPILEPPDPESAAPPPAAVPTPALEPTAEPPATARPAAGGETIEYELQDEHEGAAEHEKRGDDDVLEETPEFLQDTPEHDRLWFEQRPPRDFDLGS
jgi:hypothetical protein